METHDIAAIAATLRRAERKLRARDLHVAATFAFELRRGVPAHVLRQPDAEHDKEEEEEDDEEGSRRFIAWLGTLYEVY